MASLVEFAPAPPSFWPEVMAREESDEKRSDMLMRRYEALLRLSKCLTSARPEDLAATVAAELRPVFDFDFLDIVLNPATAEAEQSACECEIQRSSATRSSGISCFPLGEEIKSQCSIPLVSRGSELGFFVVGRFDKDDFSKDEIEFLTQMVGQVAILIGRAHV